MDTSVVVPIVVAAVAAIAGLITYTYQKWLDRRNALVDLRRTAYQDLLVSLQTHLHTRTAASLAALGSARAKAFIVASDDVAKATGDFFEASINGLSEPTNGDQVLAAYARMAIAMRKDCFERTRLGDAEVIAAAPVTWRVN